MTGLRVPQPPFLDKSRMEVTALRTVVESLDEALGAIIGGEQLVAQAESGAPDPDLSDADLGLAESAFEAHLEETFGPPLYASAVLLTTSTLEVQMTRLCHYLSRLRGSAPTFGQLHGSVLARVEEYLVKVCGWPFPAEEDWSWVKDLFHVRNCLAHWGGRVSDIPDGQIREWAVRLNRIRQRRAGIHIEAEHEVTIEDLEAQLGLREATHDGTDGSYGRRVQSVALVVEREFCFDAVDHTQAIFATLYSEWL